MQKGQKVIQDILASASESHGKLELLHLELDSLQSVRSCADSFLKKSKTLNVLINNAGMLVKSCTLYKVPCSTTPWIQQQCNFIAWLSTQESWPPPRVRQKMASRPSLASIILATFCSSNCLRRHSLPHLPLPSAHELSPSPHQDTKARPYYSMTLTSRRVATRPSKHMVSPRLQTFTLPTR